MKIRIPKCDIYELLICFIYGLMFASAIFNALSNRRNEVNMVYYRFYIYSLWFIILISLLFLLCDYIISHKISPAVVLVLMVFVYEFFITSFMGLVSTRALFTDNLSWILVFCTSYVYGQRKGFNCILLRQTIILGFLLFCIVIIPNIQNHFRGLDVLGGIIGPLYYILGFLGLILLVNRSRTQLIYVIIVVLYILFSVKRAGVIALSTGLLLYYFSRQIIVHTDTKRKKGLVYLCSIIFSILVFSWWIIDRFNIGINIRFEQMAIDGGSRRNILWRSVIANYLNSDTIFKYFGHGFLGVSKLVKPLGRQINAHNDFLEFLFDFGIVGEVFYVILLLMVVLKNIEMLKKKRWYAPAMVYSSMIALFLSSLSYFFEEARSVMPIAAIWGMCMGRLKVDE